MRSLVRALCTLALPLALIGQLCAFVHLAVVAHTMCEEHGELVEVGDDEHDHCVVGHTPGDVAGLSLLVCESLAPATACETHALEAAAAGADLLRLAPKTSPPALVG